LSIVLFIIEMDDGLMDRFIDIHSTEKGWLTKSIGCEFISHCLRKISTLYRYIPKNIGLIGIENM